MNKIMASIALTTLGLISNSASKAEYTVTEVSEEEGLTLDSASFQGYVEVNGLNMYYEIYGEGNPLVLIHGGGSTIQTHFGQAIPLLANNRRIIAVEAQAHGRTGDRKDRKSTRLNSS